jgi:hypothetical protein
MMMIDSKDFQFRDDLAKIESGDTVPIQILTGPYKDVIFRYIRVSVKEQDGGEAILQYQYELLEMGSYTETQLRKDSRFSQHIGIILNHLILESLEVRRDANRENNPEEFDEEPALYEEVPSVSKG